ncbi:MAG TPA: methyltransferase domain-containing protein [Methylomirabilota bacterium]
MKIPKKLKPLARWLDRSARQALARRRQPLDGPAAELLAQVQRYFWFHSIDLGNGVVTPGKKSLKVLRAEAEAIFGPLDLRGKSVLDIGAWNGYFSFEAKRRQAEQVLATDHHCWSPEINGRATFDLARAALELDIESLDVDVPDLSPERVGRFDVVLFLGVFYHLVDPIRALQDLAAVTNEVAVLETHLDLRAMDRPAMVFYPGTELNDDPTNWWGPNRQCVEALLRLVGFERVVYQPHPLVGDVRGIFHAYKKKTASTVTSSASAPRAADRRSPTAPAIEFHNNHYLRINQRRLEHLASLELPLSGQTVLELGAGIGDLSTFFLDRGNEVTSVEARAENVDGMRANIAAYYGPHSSEAAGRHRIVRLDLDKDDTASLGRFDIVHCYGILYHLRDPARLIHLMGATCRSLCLVETCVSLGAGSAINPTPEDAAHVSQAYDGAGCRPTRAWVMDALKSVFPHVYVPTTQPSHEEFPLDWTRPGPTGLLTRAVFVASRQPLSSAFLTDSLPDHQSRC